MMARETMDGMDPMDPMDGAGRSGAADDYCRASSGAADSRVTRAEPACDDIRRAVATFAPKT